MNSPSNKAPSAAYQPEDAPCIASLECKALIHTRECPKPVPATARLAYADPPYPGQAKAKYGTHPDYAGEIDHAALIASLAGYDGWALSTSMVALREILALCPPDVLVAAWHVTNAMPPGWNSWMWWYSWEPVIVKPARANPKVKNVLATGHQKSGMWQQSELPGHKPRPFARWVFELLGARPEDTLIDLFPGSGSIGQAWAQWSSELRLAV